METLSCLTISLEPDFTPYSLGKLIEWKPLSTCRFIAALESPPTPYSLGKLIEWKHLY